jgi:hypothetical protein
VNGDALDANRSVKWFLMATGATLYPSVLKIILIFCNLLGVSAVLYQNPNRHACLLLTPAVIHALALEYVGIPVHYPAIQALVLHVKSPPSFPVIVVVKLCHSNVLISPQVDQVPHQ